MKAQNNVQKTVSSKLISSVLRGAVIIFGVALISLTVNAQDLWQQLASNNTYENMASLFNGLPSETKNTDAAFEAIDAEVSAQFNHSSVAISNEPEIGNKLKVEDWKVNTNSFTNSFASESVEPENLMEIEPWMLSEDYFIPESTLEPVRNIEYWMLDIKNFRSKNTQDEAPENELMPIEPWITNNPNWGI